MALTGSACRLRAEALPFPRPGPRFQSAGGRESTGSREPAGSGRPVAPGTVRGPLPRILAGLRILVVDDDRDILELFTVALTACGGNVTCATNASDGLALAMQTRPHVIVSDIAMVGEDGYWLIRHLRQLPGEMQPDVPVIAATAYGREHSRSRVLAAGFTEHLQKPIDPEELCRLIAKLAGR